MSQADLYTKITDKILSDMEKGVMPWERQWKSKQRGAVAGMPSNALTGKAYRGINVLLLWCAADDMQSNDMRFCTYKQAQEAGGNVIKGSKSTPIFFYSPLNVEDKDTGIIKTVPLLRQYNVFHVSQTEGCKWKTSAVDGSAAKPEMPEDTTEFIAALKMRVQHGLGRHSSPCYVPMEDKVYMPFPDEYTSTDNYRRTLYHETVHWTGVKGRSERKFGQRFGDAQYAREELVAELGAAFICAEYGIEYCTRHASYIASWITVLRDDNKAIMQAASAAQKAVDFIRQTVLCKETTKELEDA